MSKTLITLTLLAVTLGVAQANPGALTALGPDGAPRAACPLRHTDVRVTVSGFVARVVVTQEFENPLAEPIEALYTFPLSERAAVDAMVMRTGDRTIRGTIKRREDARRIYERARARGQLASLLDQERPNVFTQTVANLMPGAQVSIRLEYVEPLAYEAGRFELAFPTVVGPRFNPPGRVPDAARITPPVTPEGTRAGHDVSIAVDVEAGVPVESVESPLHAIDVERPTPTSAHVRLRRRAEIPNRDFVLRWAVGGTGVQRAVLTHRQPGRDGYVTFVLVPPARVPAAEAAPKEMIFVIDRSGSQSGLPLTKAKETMHWILDHMHPQDTFQVVDFGSTTNVLFERPEPASPAMRARARRYIDALQANGGTMMADAVERVCRLPADANRLRIVTFMTDGYVGNDFEILGLVRRLRATSRWFPFGTGNGVNRFLLDGMAKAGGGEVEYVLLNEPGETVARKFWERIGSPVLTDVSVDFEGLDVVDAFPTAPADVWGERPLVIQARYRRAGRGRVVLRGYRQGRPYEQALDVTLPEARDAHDAIASMWARAKVDALMEQDLEALQRGRFPEPLRDAIVRVALRHRLVTQFTSFVAVEDRVVNEGGRVRTVEVPLEMPQGVRYNGVLGAGGAAEGRRALASKAAPAVAGQSALRARPMLDRAARPVSEAPATRTEREADAAPVLSEDARARLGTSLATLLAKGPGAEGAADLRDGWVRVRVKLARADADTLRRITALGLVVERRGGRTVVGLCTLATLLRIAESDGVRAVDAAPERS